MVNQDDSDHNGNHECNRDKIAHNESHLVEYYAQIIEKANNTTSSQKEDRVKPIVNHDDGR